MEKTTAAAKRLAKEHERAQRANTTVGGLQAGGGMALAAIATRDARRFERVRRVLSFPDPRTVNA